MLQGNIGKIELFDLDEFSCVYMKVAQGWIAMRSDIISQMYININVKFFRARKPSIFVFLL